MLSFGDAGPFIPRIKEAGTLVICQVQSLKQARQVREQGADIIVAQGSEAGGHGSTRSTLPLVPAIVDMVAASDRDALVVAAGGIVDGRGLAAGLMLGAGGVLVGTRFSPRKKRWPRRRRRRASSRRAATTRCAPRFSMLSAATTVQPSTLGGR
jgi:nitronate monooxygenase